MTAPVAPPLLARRVQALADFFRRVQTERMQGLPILNAALEVQAVGFRLAEPTAPGTAPASAPSAARPEPPAVAEGVLITPWFMSLLRLPLVEAPGAGRVGRASTHDFGNASFEFIGAQDPAIGFYEACALFSPMGSFSSQAQAVDTAEAVCAQLRTRPAATAPALPGRRAFFMPRPRAASLSSV